VMSAKSYAKVLRNHWGIENNLHWVSMAAKWGSTLAAPLPLAAMT
jgi:predicted transposase YbfD/YdcC